MAETARPVERWTRGPGRGLGLLVGVVFTLVGIGGGIAALRTARDVVAERRWPEVPATILTSSWDAGGDETHPYRFQVRYRYTYAGRTYEGSVYRRDWTGEADFAPIQRLLFRYAPGARVTCRVDPTRPAVAVLEPRSPAAAFAVALPLLFAGIGIALLVGNLRRRPPSLATEATVGTPGRPRRLGTYVGALTATAGLGLGASMLPWFLGPLEARSWRAVPATVVTATVRSHHGSDSTTYRVDLLYRYRFEGRTYLANRYDFIGGGSSGAEAKWRVVRRHPPGSRITVWVDPEDPVRVVVVRGFTPRHLLVLFPVALILAGLLLYRRSRRPPVGVIPDAVVGPAGAVSVRILEPGGRRVGTVVGLALFALLWNGPVAFFLTRQLQAYQQGRLDGFELLGLVPLALAQLIGLGVLGGLGYALLALVNPRTTVRLEPARPRLGEPLRIVWRTHGRVDRLQRLRIWLEGEECATYATSEGNHTRTETFRTIELASVHDRARIRQGEATVALPRETMHSFRATWNQIRWHLKVAGEIARWPDVRDGWEIEILPQYPAETPA